MSLLEQYIECMKSGNAVKLADVFDDYAVLHDSSLIRIGKDTLHLEGKMAIEMMFHHKFGFNKGPFPISSVTYPSEDKVCYFISYGDQVIPVIAFLEKVENSKIKRLVICDL